MDDQLCEPKWYQHQCFSLNQLKKYLDKMSETDPASTWVFRSQPTDKELNSTLERECEKSRIQLTEAHNIEHMVVREFRRLYDGEDRPDILKDTLYCMSLLRHYGAPTRLLDFTYSKYIALYFGLKEAYNSIKDEKNETSFALWCINVQDMNNRAKKCYENDHSFLVAFEARADINKRTDKSFQPLYMENKYDLVISENPAKLHTRLHLQQGILLFPGNIAKPFMQNLRRLYEPENTTQVKKLVCNLSRCELQKELENMRRMNITEESLFPGLDGQARSVNYKMPFYKDLYDHIHKAGGH